MQDGDSAGCSVCAPLSFIRTKFGNKFDSGRLKSAVLDLYPGEEVTAVKARLFSDVDTLKSDGMPALTRRNSENRIKPECDNILKLIKVLD